MSMEGMTVGSVVLPSTTIPPEMFPAPTVADKPFAPFPAPFFDRYAAEAQLKARITNRLTEEEVWLRALCACLACPHITTLVSTNTADEALKLFRARFPA